MNLSTIFKIVLALNFVWRNNFFYNFIGLFITYKF